MYKHYDLVVIGTGAANIVVDAAVRQGLHIAIVEKGKFGGTCLNRGCIPTKILVTAANYVREIKEAELSRNQRLLRVYGKYRYLRRYCFFYR